MLRTSLFFISALFLAACGATFTAKDCATANWIELGTNDFKAGKERSEIQNYQSICGFADNDEIVAEYNLGYKQGMEQFCTYDYGYRRGRQAAGEQANCPDGSEYFAGFDRGREEIIEERNQRKLKSLESQTGKEVSGIPGPVGP